MHLLAIDHIEGIGMQLVEPSDTLKSRGQKVFEGSAALRFGSLVERIFRYILRHDRRGREVERVVGHRL